MSAAQGVTNQVICRTCGEPIAFLGEAEVWLHQVNVPKKERDYAHQARPAAVIHTDSDRDEVPLADTVTDAKLLARVRDLIRKEHAGFIAEGNRCVEPGCSCDTLEDCLAGRDPISGPFRDPPQRCSSFEAIVLPLDPDLEEAYWHHLRTGELTVSHPCEWDDEDGRPCRRRALPGSRFCGPHGRVAELRRRREKAGKEPVLAR